MKTELFAHQIPRTCDPVGRYVVLESQDSGELYAERLVLSRTNPVIRGRVLAERFMEHGETVKVGEVKANSVDDAMHSDSVEWFKTFVVGQNDLTEEDL